MQGISYPPRCPCSLPCVFDRRGHVVSPTAQYLARAPVGKPGAARQVRLTGAMPAPPAASAAAETLRISRSTGSRDDLLTPFGKATLTDRYLMPGESFQDMFARVSCAYADDVNHAQRLYDCYEAAVVHAGDADPVQWRHQARPADLLLPRTTCRIRWTASSAPGTRMSGSPANGGGIGTYWGSVRSIGEQVEGAARPRGIIPVHPCDGRADPGDLPGLAAPGFGGGLSRYRTIRRSKSSWRSARRRATSTARA